VHCAYVMERSHYWRIGAEDRLRFERSSLACRKIHACHFGWLQRDRDVDQHAPCERRLERVERAGVCGVGYAQHDQLAGLDGCGVFTTLDVAADLRAQLSCGFARTRCVARANEHTVPGARPTHCHAAPLFTRTTYDRDPHAASLFPPKVQSRPTCASSPVKIDRVVKWSNRGPPSAFVRHMVQTGCKRCRASLRGARASQAWRMLRSRCT
jgi:hypothetical protein